MVKVNVNKKDNYQGNEANEGHTMPTPLSSGPLLLPRLSHSLTCLQLYLERSSSFVWLERELSQSHAAWQSAGKGPWLRGPQAGRNIFEFVMSNTIANA